MLKQDISIFVIDDVNTMRIQIRDLLRSYGFKRIVLASNGEEAKQLLETDPCQLVIADWHMSPTDGMELLNYVRGHPEYKHLPYVMLTAETTRDRVLEALKSGVDDFLVKPLTPHQIESRILHLLLKKQVLI
ncbi:MAG: response regulator [Bdellovibrionota bacterium]